VAGDEKPTLAVKLGESVPTYYVHGAWGGIGPRGEIVAYLFQDVQEPPSGFKLTLDEDRSRVTGETPTSEVRLERIVLARLVIPGSVAESLAKWLHQTVEHWKRAKDEV